VNNLFREFDRDLGVGMYNDDLLDWGRQDPMWNQGRLTDGTDQKSQERGGKQLQTAGNRDTRLGTTGQQGVTPLGWGGMNRELQQLSCNVDVTDEKDKYVVHAELPGIPKDTIKLNVQDGMLTLSGERKHEFKEEDKNRRYLRMERSYGNVQRSFRLPKDIKMDAITAKHDNGVLSITLPKLEPEKLQEKQKPISIQ